MNNVSLSDPIQGNVLVVDDAPANLTLLTGIFRKKGYRVRPVPSGKLALIAAEREPPDIILLDIMMPVMDGYETCRRQTASTCRSSNFPFTTKPAPGRTFHGHVVCTAQRTRHRG